MPKILKWLSPARIIALGFVFVILLGSLLLSLPCCVRDGVTVRYIDTLYTSASAVCVTGLVAVDPGDTFTPLGQIVLALLIQIGGLGVTAVGTGVILAMGKKLSLKGRSVVREAMNLDSGKGVVRFLKSVFLTTITIELCGAVLSFCVFARDYPPLRALWISLFHSVASFNSSGFDVLGGGQSLIPYRENLLLNLITCALIFLGGIGFLVIREILAKRFRWKRFSMHTKVVLSFSVVLIAVGTVLLRLTEGIPWLGALFQSVSARTAGFATYPIGGLSNAGLIVMLCLMFIGASPGSTGGGVKTTTVFALIQGIQSAATNRAEKGFRYAMPREAFRKAAVITLIALGVILTGTFLMCAMEPALSIRDILFEVVSAFGTVGLSTGVTAQLGVGSKLLSIVIMYIGRLGPMTIALLWYFSNGERVRYPEGNLAIG